LKSLDIEGMLKEVEQLRPESQGRLTDFVDFYNSLDSARTQDLKYLSKVLEPQPVKKRDRKQVRKKGAIGKPKKSKTVVETVPELNPTLSGIRYAIKTFVCRFYSALDKVVKESIKKLM